MSELLNLDVLLVEDDSGTARILTRLLESVGMTVRYAPTVAAAITALKIQPSLLILDLVLPDGTGLDVLTAVRSDNLGCKVAVVSASNDVALFTAVTALRPDAIFDKPLDVNHFIDWISSMFTEDPVASYQLTVGSLMG